ncbi:MAG TPA: hypothetical protein VF533_04830 [Solirubrobacteraceae bacterium]|jgi:hypothetical protein
MSASPPTEVRPSSAGAKIAKGAAGAAVFAALVLGPSGQVSPS